MTDSEPTASPASPTPVSVLLPTVRWTDACDEVAEQLRGPEAFGGGEGDGGDGGKGDGDGDGGKGDGDGDGGKGDGDGDGGKGDGDGDGGKGDGDGDGGKGDGDGKSDDGDGKSDDGDGKSDDGDGKSDDGDGGRNADELLVVCDSPDDPVADRRGDLPPRVRIVIAGEPEGCSGKANAIAAGMEAAANDRIAWTDDDFRHPSDWLATLDADYERRGPTTEVPVFVGLDPLARLFEPAYVIGGTLAVFAAGVAWGGAVIFERDDLRDGEAAFLRDLRRTVSDDGTLTEHLDVSAADRTRYVRAGGSLRGSLERFVRFLTITRYHAPRATAFNAAFGVVMAALCLLAPIAGVSLVTTLAGAAYARFGIRRATFLLAAPGVLIAPPLMAYALARQTFVWGGRRYRWRSMFDVSVEPV